MLLLFVIGIAFVSCNDEEILSEQIAAKISSYGSNTATIYVWKSEDYEVYKSNVAFEIEIPFLVYSEVVKDYYYTEKEVEVKHYLLLDDCCYMYKNPDEPIQLYFK